MNLLEKAYLELELKSIDEKQMHKLSNIFQLVRDTLMKNSENEEALKAQFEIDFLNFNISENKLTFIYSGTNESGEPYEYPSIKQFTEDTYNYLIERQKNVKAINLKARYSHILWLSPKREIEFAQTAIDNYLKLIQIREEQDIKFPDENFGLKVLENIKNVFFLSVSITYRIEEVKEEINRIVKKYSEKSNYSNVIKLQLIELMLKNKLIFKVDDFSGIVEVCEKLMLKSYSYSKHSVIDILNLIIKVEEKLINDTVKYERRIAELWEELSTEREDETNIVSIDFCRNALKIYKKLNDKDKVKELEKRFSKLKKNIKLAKVSQEIDLTEMMQEYRKYAEKLTDKESFVIINSLMNDKSLLPTLNQVEKLANETIKQSFLSFLANTSIIDSKGNTSQHFNDKEEYEYFQKLQNYQFSLQLSYSNLIREIIFLGIKKEKLNASTFFSFLQQNSWLGKELEMSSNSGRLIPYCWLALIAPALNDYFINLEFYFTNKKNYPNFILCIDSLSLKIEGMLRDICEFIGITTFELKPDKKARMVSQEKDIHKLLYEPELAKLIDKDDLFFFKFLLIEKAGYNLRNKVAHSLMTFNDYNLDYMNLLIMAVLKLGKYNFVVSKNNS